MSMSRMSKIAHCFAMARQYEKTARNMEREARKRKRLSENGLYYSSAGRLTHNDYYALAETAECSARWERTLGIKLIQALGSAER